MSIGAEFPRHLPVKTTRIDDPGDLVAALPDPTPVAWLRRGDGLVGWGEAVRLQLVRAGGHRDAFAAAREALRALFADAEVDDTVGVPGSGPVVFGSFTFDPAAPGSSLMLPSSVVGRRGGQAWLTTIGDPGADAFTPVRPRRDPAGLRWDGGTVDPSRWQEAVREAVTRIKAGLLDKVVLARDLWAYADDPVDPRALLRRLADRFPDCYAFACDGLVGATPELLVRREGDRVDSLVLAGSARRSNDPDEDARIGAALLDSRKDVEEHRHAVESVSSALSPLCTRVDVASRPSSLVLANVRHLATPVSGRLSDARTTVLDVVAALHPTAAVCGTPAGAAGRTIRELEGMDRGRYAGPVGWMDSGGNGEFGIALRCAQLDGRRIRLFAGGGIVAGSDLAAELAETEVKFQAMRYALTG